MSKSKLDAGIPVLTEVIEVTEVVVTPVASKPPELKPMPMRAKEPQPQLQSPPHPEIVDVPEIDGWLNEEWNRLERKIGGRILSQVMERVQADIEDRVRDALADALQMAIGTLAKDIEENLQSALHKVINEAVKEEIFHMQNSKK